MTRKIALVSATVLAFASLLGCAGGGGGGGGPTPAAPAPPPPPPPPTALNLQGASSILKITYTPTTLTVDAHDAAPSDSDFRLVLTDTDGDLSDLTDARIRVIMNNIGGYTRDRTFNFADCGGATLTCGAIAVSADITEIFAQSTAQTDIISYYDFLTVPLDHVGLITYAPPATGNPLVSADFGVSYIAVSLDGWTASMPLTGSANYAGKTVGFFVDTDGTPYHSTSNLAASANFLAGTINGSASTFSFGDINHNPVASPANLDFTFSGTIDSPNSAFSTTIVSTGGAGVLDGELHGNFAGAGADEIAGAFVASGTEGVLTGGFVAD